MVVRYKATVEYDGTAYKGFQRQLEQPTVQGALEQAINYVTGQYPTVIGAGRTDSGVHARGQVVAIDLEWHHGTETLLRALNSNLPTDIAITKLSEAEKEFHPRFNAKRRVYEYRIYNSSVRSPLRHLQSWHVAQSLDVHRMASAANTLVGLQDFATFGQPPTGSITVRQVYYSDWRRQDEYLIYKIEANAFLYRMVRSLVGSMKFVGEGAWTVEDFIAAKDACDRSRAATTAPAHGLLLDSVIYD
jgi:tRNA pseudouridine38-40 synthase